MKGQVGLWIDHRQAVIVSMRKDGVLTEIVESHVGRHVRPSGGSGSSTPYASHEVFAEDHVERKFHRDLDRYYDRVAAALHDPETILIMGPGEAREEFHRHLSRTQHAPQSEIILQKADKMTTPQVVSRVRAYFLARGQNAPAKPRGGERKRHLSRSGS